MMESFEKVRDETNVGLNVPQEMGGEEDLPEASEHKTGDKIKPHAQSKLLSTTDKCKVCNEAAAIHVHYGATTCFSCRAFFRRSIQNNSAGNYSCRRNGNCDIDLKTRKNCQFCRFYKCEEAGMKRNWVLSVDERRRRFKQKNKMEDVEKKSKKSTMQIEKKQKYWKQNKYRSENVAESEEGSQKEKNIFHGLDLSSLKLNNNTTGGLRIKRQAELQEKLRTQDQINSQQIEFSPQQQNHFEGRQMFACTKKDPPISSSPGFHPQFPITPFQDFLSRSQQFEGYKRPRRTTFPGVEREQILIDESRSSLSKFGLDTDNLKNQTELVGNKQHDVSFPNDPLRQQESLRNYYRQHFQHQFQQYAQRKVPTEENRTQRPGVIVHPHQQMAQCQHDSLFLQHRQQLTQNCMRQHQSILTNPFMRQNLPFVDTGFSYSSPRISSNKISQNLPQLLLSQQEKEMKYDIESEAGEQSEEYTESEDEHWVNDPAKRLEVILNEPEIHFTEEENYQLTTIVSKHNERYKSVNFGEELMKEFVMSAMFGIRISPRASMSGYKLLIERVTRISNNLPEFVGLTKPDQAVLLKENADMLVSLRASLFFDKSKKGIDTLLSCMGIDDIETTKMMFTTLTKENPMKNINYKSFNSIQTTNNQSVEERNTFLQTRVAEMISDEVSTILITYIILFSTDFCSLRDNRRIDQIQNTYIRILQRYLYSKYIRSKARSLLAGTLCAVTCVRELTDIKKGREISQNVQYTEA